MNKRLFWTVEYVTEDEQTTTEIFQTRAQAEKFFNENKGWKMGISEVLNYYSEKDENGDERYNYDDYSDTFDDVITIMTETNNSPYKN